MPVGEHLMELHKRKGQNVDKTCSDLPGVQQCGIGQESCENTQESSEASASTYTTFWRLHQRGERLQKMRRKKSTDDLTNSRPFHLKTNGKGHSGVIITKDFSRSNATLTPMMSFGVFLAWAASAGASKTADCVKYIDEFPSPDRASSSQC